MSQSPNTKPSSKAKRFGVPWEIVLIVGTGVLAYTMYIGYFLR